MGTHFYQFLFLIDLHSQSNLDLYLGYIIFNLENKTNIWYTFYYEQ